MSGLTQLDDKNGTPIPTDPGSLGSRGRTCSSSVFVGMRPRSDSGCAAMNSRSSSTTAEKSFHRRRGWRAVRNRITRAALMWPPRCRIACQETQQRLTFCSHRFAIRTDSASKAAESLGLRAKAAEGRKSWT